MKIKSNDNDFEACPEYNGKAVCVDVTPLRKQQSEYGERDVFKLVFEVDLDREDGSRFCVWSRNFTPSLNEKANFRKFLRGWFGRDLAKEELEDFDTETLLGKPAQLVVVHEHKDNLEPSGKYVRRKDRTDEGGKQAANGKSGGASGAQGGYRHAQQTESADGDLGGTKIHVGRCKGLEVRDLSPEQVQALIGNWLPGAKASAKPSADDKRLIAALEWWEKENVADNVPY